MRFSENLEVLKSKSAWKDSQVVELNKTKIRGFLMLRKMKIKLNIKI